MFCSLLMNCSPVSLKVNQEFSQSQQGCFCVHPDLNASVSASELNVKKLLHSLIKVPRVCLKLCPLRQIQATPTAVCGSILCKLPLFAIT